MTVAVEYAKDVLVLRLSYYLERIAHPLASRIADAFAAVVCNFIEGSEELVPSVVCKLAQDPAEATHFPQALKYWQEKMQSFVDVSTFPAAPNRLYKVDLTSSASIQIDLPPAGGRISTSTLLRASWALILSRQSASDRIVFGVMTDGKVGGRGIRIGNMTGKAGSTAAVVPYAVHVDQLLPLALSCRACTISGTACYLSCMRTWIGSDQFAQAQTRLAASKTCSWFRTMADVREKGRLGWRFRRPPMPLSISSNTPFINWPRTIVLYS